MEKASTADMVKDAIKTLGERTGSSLHNIKKYIEAVYKVDMRYRAPRIRQFLRAAVGDGVVVQTRGRGASGSFKMPPKQPSATALARKAASSNSQAVAKKASSRTTASATVRKASSTTASTTVSTTASRTSARSAASASSISTTSTASTKSAKSNRARRL